MTQPACQVATYWGDCAIPRTGHEFATLEALARDIADIKGRPYVGHFDPARHHAGVTYFVPRDTLSKGEVERLGIAGHGQLFGGAVVHPFIATKVITHPLVEEFARAPSGWSSDFPATVADVVLYGYSAFTRADALEAARRVLERGRARFKPANGIGGRGQAIVSSTVEAEAFLTGCDETDLQNFGVVIEQDLANAATLSVGQIHWDDLCVTYFGTQRQTPDHRGESVYGGSDLYLVRGGFEALLEVAPDADTADAIRRAMRYDAAAERMFAPFFASRRNYDLVIGQDVDGRRCAGVLEQSWRAGGASPAELLAVRAFLASPAVATLRTATVEAYGEVDVPPQAAVTYRGVDPRIGPLTKYSLVCADGILRCAA